ncbi:hypothetical protein M427DRAFT_461569 [Gonapodya prolifera JEL478]|uniref:Xylanolytic transcriptional activator regulatory domain-containing protein n=1 Tax=Gonapodya prolifera (strain JEL478) TaxID=1344416 RepID=A0A139A2A8_GONPJ|nr:hypothetical protein M427DRAFT_461569 [Gonapodya prolifera JEL478]|eukprot:KXS10778.1 hypothetical protein M427DRAFT_461569 [Gonapodya prolifera JEL478]
MRSLQSPSSRRSFFRSHDGNHRARARQKAPTAMPQREVQQFDEPLDTLPPPETMAELLNLYFKFVQPALGLVYKPSFLKTLSLDGRGPPSLLLLNCLMCYGARFQTTAQTPEWTIGRFWSKIRRLLTAELEKPPTLTTVVALIHASVLVHVLPGKSWLVTRYTDLAVDRALALRLNHELTFEEASNSSWFEIELRRRAWWMLYVWERLGSASTGGHCNYRTTQENSLIAFNINANQLDDPAYFELAIPKSPHPIVSGGLLFGPDNIPEPTHTVAWNTMIVDGFGRALQIHASCAQRDLTPWDEHPPGTIEFVFKAKVLEDLVGCL